MIRRFFGSTVKVGNNPNYFIGLWKTDNAGVSASNQIQLPITLGATPNMEVDWGDGNTDFNTTLHTYASAGTYQITVKQHGYTGFAFVNGGDKLKLIEIEQWGGIYFSASSTGNMYGCQNMISSATDLPDVSHKTDFGNMFRDCYLFNQSIENLAVQNGTNFGSMMQYCYAFNRPIENLAIQNGPNLVAMLFDCSSFNQPLGGLSVETVTDLSFFATGTAISTANYDQTLIGWSNKVLQPNVSCHMGNSQYTATGETAKNQIIANYNWTFTDGGLAT